MDGRRTVRQLGVAALGMGLVWALTLLGDGPTPQRAQDQDHAQAELSASAIPLHSRASERRVRVPAQPVAMTPPTAAAVPEPDQHPHPITAEHRRLQRELQLIAAMNDALDRQDGKSLRELVGRYADHDPQDTQGLQQGYRQLADCLQQPSLATTQAAQAYYDRERASVLRRYIRRTCLERGAVPTL